MDDFMSLALAEANLALKKGEIPVGALIVDPIKKVVLASSGNRVITDSDPTAHAEILVIREAAKIYGSSKLIGLDIYATLEPCAMCASAISMSRLRKLVFGAYDPKTGAVDHGPKIFSQKTTHHKPEVIGGVREEESSEYLKVFFKLMRS